MDAIALLSSDHRKIRLLFGEYRSAATDRRRRAAADSLVRELSQHLTAEERVFYPYAARVLDEDSTARARQISSKLRKHLAVLDDHRTAAEDDAMSMDQLERDVAEHIAEDEHKLMPRVRGACDEKALRKLGLRLDQVERGAPTRPHPPTANGRPQPNHSLKSPFIALYDRMRDRVHGRVQGKGNR
jgi:hemerythrin superfamily protein